MNVKCINTNINILKVNTIMNGQSRFIKINTKRTERTQTEKLDKILKVNKLITITT